MNSPKTDDEHLVFLKQWSALMVHFALRWQKNHPGTTLAQALTERTFFVNLGAWHAGEIYDHPQVEGDDLARWLQFLANAEALSSHAQAEQEILALLPSDADYFAPRVARDQAELHHPVRGLAARSGSLWTMGQPGAIGLPEYPNAPPAMEFHIANHRYPESFLKDTQAIREELRGLARKARERGFEAIGTRTWLNDVPAWLECFPAVWQERLTPRDFDAVGGHLGCWGQTVTARQTLSRHAEASIRQNGRFEFAMRASWIRTEELLGE